EFALGADFAGHAGDLVGEGGELVDHRVDGVLQLGRAHLCTPVARLRRMAGRHRRRHLGDVAHLVGQAVRHRVDVVGEVLPDAGDALDVGASAEFALGADYAGHAGDLVGAGGQPADLRVHDVLELDHLAVDVHV